MIPVYRAYRFHQESRKILKGKPNILVVSICSLRMNLLHHYGAVGGKITPNIDGFFRKSTFVFDNAINVLSWTNLTNYTSANIPLDEYLKTGYRQNGHMSYSHQWRVPYRLSYTADFKGQILNDNDFEKNHKKVTEALPAIMQQERREPFFSIVHFKYLHYPLIDRFNGSAAAWDRFLSEEQKAKVTDYLNHPDKYFGKLPLMLMLANNPQHILAHPRFQNTSKRDPASLRSLTGLMTNPTLLAEWKASKGYAEDLEILEKIYRANVHYLDQVLAPLLNLYGNKKLQENTIVIFTGDHGEMHMERDELTHGHSLWEQSLRIPLAIRFPDSWGQDVIREQVDLNALSKAIRAAFHGENTAEEFQANLAKFSSEALVARNCTNTLRGVRYKNKYKYFVRLADGERFLFDLEKDPGETTNLSQQIPEEADRMEVLYWQNLDSIAKVDPNHCAPSVPKATGDEFD